MLYKESDNSNKANEDEISSEVEKNDRSSAYQLLLNYSNPKNYLFSFENLIPELSNIFSKLNSLKTKPHSYFELLKFTVEEPKTEGALDLSEAFINVLLKLAFDRDISKITRKDQFFRVILNISGPDKWIRHDDSFQLLRVESVNLKS